VCEVCVCVYAIRVSVCVCVFMYADVQIRYSNLCVLREWVAVRCVCTFMFNNMNVCERVMR
jgi:hypothetical protein